MTERTVKPWVQQTLELGPTLIFFAVYMWIRDDKFLIGSTTYSGFIVAALVFIPILLIAMGILWRLTGKLSRLQILTAFMVIFFGALTAWFNDERFFKMKTTIVYGSFAVILGLGLWRRQSYLQWVMHAALPMRQEGWMILTRRLAMMFAALAVANEIVWRTQSTDLWVKLETFAFPIALFVFLWVQIVALQRYLIEPPKGGDSSSS